MKYAIVVASVLAAALLWVLGSAPGAAQTSGGGPVYDGAPDLPLTMAFIDAGGGPGDFSTVRAMDRSFGTPAMQSGLQQLATLYGPATRDRFIETFDFAINDAWGRAGQANLRMPAPSAVGGRALANELLRAGTASDGAFWSQVFLGRMLSEPVATTVLHDIDARYGPGSSDRFLRTANQFFFDLSQRIDAGVALAPMH
jgi:hypothetical protein